MSRTRWFRNATAAALVVSAATFGTALPAQANPARATTAPAATAPAATAPAAAMPAATAPAATMPAAVTPAGAAGTGRLVAASRATIEEIMAIAAKGDGTLFTLNTTRAGVLYTIYCYLNISPPVGGGSPGASVQVDAALQCTDWEDLVALYVELWRDLGQVATSGATLLHSYGLYVSARESTCRNGIYWGVATAYARRSGFTPPSVVLHVHSVPLPVGCGSAPPPPPPPPVTVSVTNPGNQFNYVWDSPALQMRASGGSGTYAWSANGLPPGLHINSSTGLISGTITATGTYTVTVTAVAGVGSEGYTSFTWSVVRESCRYC